jgi:hypothetical protein
VGVTFDLIREVYADLRVFQHLSLQVLHRELLIFRNYDLLDLTLTEQLFLISQHLLDEVFVNSSDRRHVVLHYMSEGDDESNLRIWLI